MDFQFDAWITFLEAAVSEVSNFSDSPRTVSNVGFPFKAIASTRVCGISNSPANTFASCSSFERLPSQLSTSRALQTLSLGP